MFHRKIPECSEHDGRINCSLAVVVNVTGEKGNYTFIIFICENFNYLLFILGGVEFSTNTKYNV